jgi:uncharacterized protein YkwD
MRLLLIAAAILLLHSAQALAAAGRSDTASLVAKSINVVRAKHGLPRLRVSAALSAAAHAHDVEMGKHGYFGHESRDGSAFWQRVERWYTPSGRSTWFVGENILWEEPTISAWTAVAKWMGSPEHRANVLNPAWREVGVDVLHLASAPGVYRGVELTLITTDFGVRG